MKYSYLIASILCWIYVKPGKGIKNLAINRPAWQSTTFDGSQYRNVPYHAKKSVDGNKDTDINNGGCSRTNAEENPWWIVGLRQQYCITKVTITWRNKYSNKQNGVFLAVGTEFDGKQFQKQAYYQCVKVQVAKDGGTKHFDCSGIKGSFVSLYRSDNNTRIEMCEVEVYGYKGICAVNLALNRKTQQDTTYDFHPRPISSNAVDGNKDTDLLKGSCSQTKVLPVPTAAWWVVFLDQEYHITKATITWRNNYADLLNNAEVLIGSSVNGSNFERKDFVRCAVISGLPVMNATKTSVNCQEKKGSSVSIYQSTRIKRFRIVHMCEVEVFGFKAPVETIQDGKIYQFNYQALALSDATQQCINRNRTLLSSVHLIQRHFKSYLSGQMVRLGLKQSWISSVGTQCSYILDNGIISTTECEDRYGYVCITEPKKHLCQEIYYIYATQVDFFSAQETCKSTKQTMIRQSAIANIREQLDKHGLQSVWIAPETLSGHRFLQQCVAHTVGCGGGSVHLNCADTYAFVCVEDSPTAPTAIEITTVETTSILLDGHILTKSAGRPERLTTSETAIPVAGMYTTCTVTTALPIIAAFLVLSIIVNVVLLAVIWRMRNSFVASTSKQVHHDTLELQRDLTVDKTQGLMADKTVEQTTSRKSDPNKVDTATYYNINDVRETFPMETGDTYVHLELRTSADLEAETQYEQLR